MKTMKATLRFQTSTYETVQTFEGVAVSEVSAPNPVYPVGSLCIEDDLTMEPPPGAWKIVHVEVDFEDGRRARFSDEDSNWYGRYDVDEDGGDCELFGGGQVSTGRQDL